MILDTNAVSALFKGDAALRDRLGTRPHHHLPVIVIGEYLYGLLRSRYQQQLARLLDELVRESIVLSVDGTTASFYAEVRDALRRRGRPIPENDVWIGALALQHGIAVVSRDQHFEEIEGLERVAW